MLIYYEDEKDLRLAIGEANVHKLHMPFRAVIFIELMENIYINQAETKDFRFVDQPAKQAKVN